MNLAHPLVAGFLITEIFLAGNALAQSGPDPELREALRVAASDTTSFSDRFEA